MKARSPKPTPSRKKPRQGRSQQTRLDLLEGATRVLDDRGADGFTTNHVAERAGVSVGSLYQYYPNKAALLADLHAETGANLWKDLEDTLRDAREPLRVRLGHALDAAFLAQAAAHEHHVALQQSGIDVADTQELVSLARQFEAVLVYLLIQELGRAPEHAARQAAFSVMTVFGLLAQLGKRPESEGTARQLAAQTTQMLSAYLNLPE